MSHLTIDLSADDDTLEKAILFLASLRTVKPGAKTLTESPAQGQPMFTPQETMEQNLINQQADSSLKDQIINGPDIPNNPFAGTEPTIITNEAPKQETAAPTVSTEVDAAGYPWDERIHSSSRAKTTKGVWKLRRGVDKAIVKQVQAELMGGNQEPAPQQEMAQPQFPPMQQAPANPFASNPVTTPGPQATQQVQQPNGNGAALTWPVLLQRITTANQGGTFNQTASDQFLNANGVTGGVAMLSQRPDLFEAYAQTVGV